jgi:NADH-quinone oxidoreductase subunit G
MAALAGDLCDAESMLALKDLMRALGSPHTDCRQDGAKIDPAWRAGYLFNTTIAGIEEADACLLVGTDPRKEGAMVNARLRKRFLRGGFRVGVIGAPVDLTYEVEQLGAGPETLKELADGKGAFAEVLKNAEKPMIVVGMGALARPDGAAVLHEARRLAETFDMVRDDWNGFNVLHTAAARVAGLDLGFLPGEGGRDTAGILEGAETGEIDAVYLLGADEIDTARLGKAFVIYQGHHGDAGAHRADVILPGAAYTEKNATYVNTEGRVQLGRLAANPPGDAREDWAILRALSGYVAKKPLPYDNLGEVRQKLIETAKTFAAVDQVPQTAWGEFGAAGEFDPAPFGRAIENFYMTDPISRNSETMARCTEAFVLPKQKATGTHG